MDWKKIFCLCPYTHIVKTVRTAIREKKMPRSSRSGLIIAALGLFCPLFWVPFFLGATLEELKYDILHSSIFIVIGLVLFVCGFISEKK